MNEDAPSTPPGQENQPWPLKKTVALWVGLTLIVMAVTLAWLLGSPWEWGDRSSQDLLQTAQAVVLSLGFLGVVGGSVIAYRRHEIERETLELERERQDLDKQKQSEERTRFQLEQVQARERSEYERERLRQEQLRLDERSRHERYAKGAQMLAADSPGLRIAGLNVIAGLGREVAPGDEFRQMAVDLLCAYLRANSPAAAEDPEDSLVAKEACLLLPGLFVHEDIQGVEDRTQRAPSINLAGAALFSLDFSQRIVGNIDFSFARFYGRTKFARSVVLGTADFSFTKWNGADFQGCEFKSAYFADAIFTLRPNFASIAVDRVFWGRGADFQTGADFSHAHFGSHTDFRSSQVGPVDFGSATFGPLVEFGGCLFGAGSHLDDIQFASPERSFAGALFPHISGPTNLEPPVEDSAIQQFHGALFGQSAADEWARSHTSP